VEDVKMRRSVEMSGTMPRHAFGLKTFVELKGSARKGVTANPAVSVVTVGVDPDAVPNSLPPGVFHVRNRERIAKASI